MIDPITPKGIFPEPGQKDGQPRLNTCLGIDEEVQKSLSKLMDEFRLAPDDELYVTDYKSKVERALGRMTREVMAKLPGTTFLETFEVSSERT
jgi:hypothetical protein